MRKIGLYPRLFLAFVAVALVPLTTSYLMHVAATKKETLELAHELIEQVATVQQRRLNFAFKQLNDQLGLVASRTQMRQSLERFATTGDPAEWAMVERILKDLLASSEDMVGVWLHHADGRTVVGVPETSPPIPDWESGDPSLRFHWDNGTVGGIWLAGSLALDGREIGTVHVLTRLNRLHEMLDDFSQVATGGRSLLILQDPGKGLVPVRGDTQHELDTVLSAMLQNDQGPVATAIRSGASTIGVDEAQNLIFTYRSLRAAESGTLIYMRLEHLEQTLARQRANLALVVFVVLSMSILMAAFFARMIARPILDLTQGAERIKRGDLNARVTPRHWGEFALLTESFNATANALQQHTEALNAEIETRQHAQHELISIANCDPLTRLYNRRYILDALEQRIRECDAGHSGGAILFIDLDGFKPVNDTYGHEAGDATLRIVAERLLHLVRSQDCVARFGGDEFVMLLGQPASSTDPETIAKRIDHALSEPIIHKTHRIQIGGSVGIACLQPGVTAEQVLALADSRMYRTKMAKHPKRGETKLNLPFGDILDTPAGQ